jgi:hypothetical protein
MEGTWQISSFIQQDPNNPIKEERDLSDFYIVPGETPYRLTFQLVQIELYAVVDQDLVKNFFGNRRNMGV